MDEDQKELQEYIDAKIIETDREAWAMWCLSAAFYAGFFVSGALWPAIIGGGLMWMARVNWVFNEQVRKDFKNG